jgi:transposase
VAVTVRAIVAVSHDCSDRNVIERCYCRLKDFRRIATRYDKLARNYFSALCLVAAVAFWL